MKRSVIAAAVVATCFFIHHSSAGAHSVLTANALESTNHQSRSNEQRLGDEFDSILASRAPPKPFLFGLTLDQLLPDTAAANAAKQASSSAAPQLTPLTIGESSSQRLREQSLLSSELPSSTRPSSHSSERTLTESSNVGSTSHTLTDTSVPVVDAVQPYRGWKYPTPEAARAARNLRARKMKHQLKLDQLRAEGVAEAELPIFDPSKKRPNVRRMKVRPGMSEEEKARERLRARRESYADRRGAPGSDRRARYNAYIAQIKRKKRSGSANAGRRRRGRKEPASDEQRTEEASELHSKSTPSSSD